MAANAVCEAILAGNRQHRPIYTTSHILGELVTLLLRYSYIITVQALDQIRNSPSVTVIHPDRVAFEAAVTALDRYDDQAILLVNHLTGVLADERDVDRLFAYNSDFRTLRFTLVPNDTGLVYVISSSKDSTRMKTSLPQFESTNPPLQAKAPRNLRSLAKVRITDSATFARTSVSK